MLGFKVDPQMLSPLPSLFSFTFLSLSYHTESLDRNEKEHHLFIAIPTKARHLSTANLSHE